MIAISTLFVAAASASPIRVQHASPDAPAVDVLVNGKAAFTNLSFPGVTAWANLPAGNYHVQVVPAGKASPAVIDLPDVRITPDPNGFTVAAINKLDNITALVIPDNGMGPKPDQDMCAVRFAHLSPDAPAVSVWANDQPLIPSLEYAKVIPEGHMRLPAGKTYAVAVSVAGSSPPAFVLNASYPCVAGNDQTVSVVGLVKGSPKLQVVLSDDSDRTLSAKAESILDIATNSPVHTKFVAILTSGKYNAILDAAKAATATNPLTVFAPTNDAFDAAEKALGFDFATTTVPAEIAAVTEVLEYHVMAGALNAATLVKNYNTATVLGSQAIVKVVSGQAIIEGRTPVDITAMVEASNGWVHVTSAVILIPDTIAKIASETPAVSTLYAVLGLPEYKDILDVVAGATAKAPLTVFAPTDDAFKAAGIDVPFVTNPRNIATVKKVLTYHVAAANVFAGPLADGTQADVKTVEGGSVKVSKRGSTVTVNDATVVAGDVLAANGVVHVINKVLMPSAELVSRKAENILQIAVGSPVHTRFVEILTSGNYDAVLGAIENATPAAPLTVFAPVNEAFAAAEAALGFNFATTTVPAEIAAVTDVLLYHAFGGALDAGTLLSNYNTASVGGSQAIVKIDRPSPQAVILGKTAVIIAQNIEASNGWVHVTSGVILIPDTIAKIASETPAVSTLYAVLGLPQYADILAVVAGATPEKPLTVFAPTDAAFAAAGIDVPFVTNPANVETVKKVLTYHVAPANVFAGGLADGSYEVDTAEGSKVTVTVRAGSVAVNDAEVVVGDVLASDGVVHVIDKVLMPAKQLRRQ